jgi:hypothetical protein
VAEYQRKLVVSVFWKNLTSVSVSVLNSKLFFWQLDLTSFLRRIQLCRPGSAGDISADEKLEDLDFG